MRKLLSPFKFPLFFSLVSFILILIFYPLPFQKSIQVEVREDISFPYLYEFDDMDGDGVSELLHTGYNRLTDHTLPFVRISRGLNSRATVLEQINLVHKKLTWRASTMHGDFNNNGLREQYIFTVGDSTLFLEAFEYDPDPKKISLFLNRKICSLNMYKGKIDMNIPTRYEFLDLNGDGFLEVVFIVNGLYTAAPRGIYAYDIQNDSLWHSNTQSIHYIDFQSLQLDEHTYFGAYTGTVHNCHEPLPDYHDHCGWAILLNERLELVFPPDSNYHGYHYDVKSYPIQYDDQLHLLSLFMTPDNSDESGELLLYTTEGRIAAKSKLPILGRFSSRMSGKGNDSLVIVKNDQSWLGYLKEGLEINPYSDPDLKDVSLKYLSPIIMWRKEYSIGQAIQSQSITLLNSRKREIAEIGLPDLSGHYKISFGSVDGEYGIIMSNSNRTQFIEFISNPNYAYRYIFWLLIFLGLFGFFMLMKLVFNYQLRRQQHIREELIKGQLAISKKQLEPHFMLNMLNNIGALFAKEDTRQGQYYFGKYASLLHRGLKYADQIETSLQEELDFIEDYMVLQKMRFDGELEYNIEVEASIQPELVNIPHSLLYTFVENAIKHGLAPKDGERVLKISVRSTGKHIEISIRDNGIGRKRSAELQTTGTGKGIGIVEKIIISYNKLNGENIHFVTHDLDQGTDINISI